MNERQSLILENLTIEYAFRGTVIRAVQNVSLQIPSSNYTLGVVGESGSGKTTLGMSIINMIEPPGLVKSGSVIYHGDDVMKMAKENLRKYRWREVSMIYQSAMNSLSPVKTVEDHLIQVMREHETVSKNEARERALKLLTEVGLDASLSGDYPHELSGGMRQRAVIALALALSPKILIADEPTSALDVVTQKQILTLLKKYVTERNLTLLFITHEISVLAGLVDNIVVMYSGEFAEIGPLEKVLSDPLHPYTEMLLGTLLTWDSPRSILEGNDDLTESFRGPNLNACNYSNRCKYVFERCNRERPALRKIQEDRWVACHKF